MLEELRKKLDNKEISTAELCGEYIERIKKYDNKINSHITLCDTAEDIKRAQEMINAGEAMPMTGIPISVKDNICTKGVKTTCASKMLAAFVPCYDAHAVELLKNNGAVILGKTNMDEFAMGSRGDTSYFGAVCNPYNVNCSAGGSSAGSAAAVAARFCPAALGSDTGGSVRLPSAFCGVTGLNPTYGRISRYGLIAFASSLDRIGIIASSARDAGYILNVIDKADKRDGTHSVHEGGSLKKKIRVGISESFFKMADDDVQNACETAVDFFAHCGFECVSVALPSVKYAVPAYYLISSAEAASNLARFDGLKFGYCSDGENFSEMLLATRTEAFGKEVKRRIMIGNYALSADRRSEYYQKALRVREKIKEEFDAVFEKCDIFLSPTAPSAADKLKSKTAEVYSEDVFNAVSSLAGLPSVTTPCGYTKSGMPIGMNITGRAFDEKTILFAADLFEQIFKRQEAEL